MRVHVWTNLNPVIRGGAAILVVLLACRQPDPPDDGALVVRFKVTASPEPDLGGLEALRFVSERIEVVHRSKPEDESTERLLIVDRERRSASIELVEGNVEQLGVFPVPPGAVFQVRFVSESVSAVAGGQEQRVRLPSGEQTGLKLVPPKGRFFPIATREPTYIEARFDPNERMVNNRGIGFLLKPTVEAVHLARPASREGGGIVPGQVVVGFFPGTSQRVIDEAIAAKRATVRAVGFQGTYYSLRLPPDVTIADALEFYDGRPEVEFTLPDTFLTERQVPQALSNDEKAAAQASTYTAIGAPAAYAVTKGNRSIVVAVIEAGGFDIDHPDLVDNIWINEGELPSDFKQQIDTSGATHKAADCDDDGVISFADLNCRDCTLAAPGKTAEETCNERMAPLRSRLSIPAGDITPSVLLAAVRDGNSDPAANDKPDDVIGWDFSDEDDPNPSLTSPAGVSPRRLNHGTAMAGTIAAVGNNMRDIHGTAWRARLMLLRAPQRTDWIRAMEYAVKMGADIINLSGGELWHTGEIPKRGAEDCAVNGSAGEGDMAGKKERAQKEFDKVDLSRTLLVVAAANCPVDIEEERFFDWPAEAQSKTNSKVVVTSRSATQGATGRTVIDLAAPGFPGASLMHRLSETGQSSTTGAQDEEFLPSGTSFATAYVSGTAALTLAALGQLRGRPECLRDQLRRNAKPSTVFDLAHVSTRGIVDMGRTVTNAVREPTVATCPLLP